MKAAAAQVVGVLRAISRRCDDVVIHMHEPDDEMRALVLEIERRVPECCRVSLGGVVTTIEVVTGPERTALAAKLAVHVPAAWHPYGEALQEPGTPLTGWLSAELVLPGDHAVSWTVHRLEQPPGWDGQDSSESARLAAGYVLADLYRQALAAGAGGEPWFVDYQRKAS